MVSTIGAVAFLLIAVSQFKPQSQERPHKVQSQNIVSTFRFVMDCCAKNLTYTYYLNEANIPKNREHKTKTQEK